MTQNIVSLYVTTDFNRISDNWLHKQTFEHLLQNPYIGLIFINKYALFYLVVLVIS